MMILTLYAIAKTVYDVSQLLGDDASKEKREKAVKSLAKRAACNLVFPGLGELLAVDEAADALSSVSDANDLA